MALPTLACSSGLEVPKALTQHSHLEWEEFVLFLGKEQWEGKNPVQGGGDSCHFPSVCRHRAPLVFRVILWRW